MEKIITESTSKQSASIEDRVLEETQTTRKIFRPEIVINDNIPEATLKGYLIHQKKGKNDEWEDISEFTLRDLKKGEGVKFEFKSELLLKFFSELETLYNISNKGINFGKKTHTLLTWDDLGNITWDDFEYIKEILSTEGNKKALIKQFLKLDLSKDILNEIVAETPDIATKLLWANIQKGRKAILNEFKDNLLDENKKEDYWQKLFEKNVWIFGYGLNYQFLDLTLGQPYLGGKAVDNKGGQKGDLLTNTTGINKFTVNIELKTPFTNIVNASSKNSKDTAVLGSKLIEAVSQLQIYLRTWEIEGSKQEKTKEMLNEKKIYTIKPKGYLIIGNTSQLDTIEKRNTFELFRQSINNLEIITYDELYERAKYIVEDV